MFCVCWFKCKSHSSLLLITDNVIWMTSGIGNNQSKGNHLHIIGQDRVPKTNFKNAWKSVHNPTQHRWAVVINYWSNCYFLYFLHQYSVSHLVQFEHLWDYLLATCGCEPISQCCKDNATLSPTACTGCSCVKMCMGLSSLWWIFDLVVPV